MIKEGLFQMMIFLLKELSIKGKLENFIQEIFILKEI